MSNIPTVARLLTAIPAILLVSGAAFADPESAAITEFCAGCHGQDGVSDNPLVPTLAGQPYTLIEDNLLAFRAGKRACAPERDDGSPSAQLAQTMCAGVAELTDGQIAALAEHFERRDFEPAGQTFEPSLVERGKRLHVEKGCERCHADGGRMTQSMAPILAGQWTPYLRRAMEALKSGSKQGPKVMNAAIHELDEREIEALLNYYASRPYLEGDSPASGMTHAGQTQRQRQRAPGGRLHPR